MQIIERIERKYEKWAQRRAVNAAYAKLKMLKNNREINMIDEYMFKSACAGLYELMGFVPGMYIKDVAKMREGKRNYLGIAINTAEEVILNAKTTDDNSRTEEAGNMRGSEKNRGRKQKSHQATR